MKTSLLVVLVIALCTESGNSGHQPRLGGARLEGIHKSFMVQVVIDWGTLPKSTLGMPDVEMGDPTFSLTCFTCKDATSNLHCLSTTTCSDHEKYCLTTYSTTGLGNDRNQRISKKCSAFCPTIDLNIGIAGVATSCCETSLCNISGASSVKTSYTMIALGVLASLACILRLGF